MADNLAYTPGAGATIRTDEVAVNGGAAAHVQYVKLVDGTENGVDGIPGSAARGLKVNAAPTRIVYSQQLTVTAGAYSAGFAVGEEIVIAGAAASANGTGVITHVLVSDKTQQSWEFALIVYNATIAGADFAQFDPTDADLSKMIGAVQIEPVSGQSLWAFNDNDIHSVPANLPFKCVGSTLFGRLFLTGATTPTFVSTSDVRITVTIEQG